MHFLTKITAYPSARLAVDFHPPLQNVFNLKLNWMVDIQKNYLKKVTTVFLFLLCQCTPFVPSNKPLTSAVISYNYSYNHTNSLWLLQNFNTEAEGLSTQNISGTTDPTRMTPPELQLGILTTLNLDLKSLVIQTRFTSVKLNSTSLSRWSQTLFQN